MSFPTLGRLLIVDDETELLAALCESLADQNYDAIGAPSAEEGLRRVQSERFDLVITDLMMPGMDGVQFFRKVREIDPCVTGIVMTGQGSITTAVEAMKAGAFDYLLKPFNLHIMLPVLARAMEVRRLRMENVRLREYVGQLTFGRLAIRSSARALRSSTSSTSSRRLPAPTSPS